MSVTLSDLLSACVTSREEYEAAHLEQLGGAPCTCERKHRERTGSATRCVGAALEPQDLDPDCELHFPWVREGAVDREQAFRLWFAGYQAGYATGRASAEQDARDGRWARCNRCGGTNILFGLDANDREDGSYVCDDCDHEGMLDGGEGAEGEPYADQGEAASVYGRDFGVEPPATTTSADYADEQDPDLPPVGARVRLAGDVARFPHFLAPAGLLGTVVRDEDGVYAVRMDERVHGAESWDNEVLWSLRDGDDPRDDLVVDDDPRPLAPRLDKAGWGVPDPDGGDYLSDGHDTADDALRAARVALRERREAPSRAGASGPAPSGDPVCEDCGKEVEEGFTLCESCESQRSYDLASSDMVIGLSQASADLLRRIVAHVREEAHDAPDPHWLEEHYEATSEQFDLLVRELGA